MAGILARAICIEQVKEDHPGTILTSSQIPNWLKISKIALNHPEKGLQQRTWTPGGAGAPGVLILYSLGGPPILHSDAWGLEYIQLSIPEVHTRGRGPVFGVSLESPLNEGGISSHHPGPPTPRDPRQPPGGLDVLQKTWDAASWQ